MNEPKKKFKIVTDTRARVVLPNALTLLSLHWSQFNKFCIKSKFYISDNCSFSCSCNRRSRCKRIARLIKGTSKVGKELDSLTDVISFGVAPAFIMYFWVLNTLVKLDGLYL